MVQDIAEGLIDYMRHNKRFEVHKDKYELKSH